MQGAVLCFVLYTPLGTLVVVVVVVVIWHSVAHSGHGVSPVALQSILPPKIERVASRDPLKHISALLIHAPKRGSKLGGFSTGQQPHPLSQSVLPSLEEAPILQKQARRGWGDPWPSWVPWPRGGLNSLFLM